MNSAGVLTWDDQVGVQVAPVRVSVGSLIEHVQMALESPAIAYWVVRAFDIKRAKFAESDMPDFPWCYEFKIEDEDGKVFTVNTNTIRDGLRRVCDSSFRVNSAYREMIMSELMQDLSGGDFDSDCLDVVIQAGLFGEIVYG